MLITLVVAGDVGDELLFEVSDLFRLDAVQVTTDTSVDDADLLADWHWLVLVLLLAGLARIFNR